MKSLRSKTHAAAFAAYLALISLAWAAPQEATKPTIAIIVVPPYDAGGPDKMDTISGTVTGACSDCKVVLFARGDVWYVQPYANQTDTSISSDGKWSSDTHLGTEYAAVLVRSGYKAPAKVGSLPSEGGAVLAIARVHGKK